MAGPTIQERVRSWYEARGAEGGTPEECYLAIAREGEKERSIGGRVSELLREGALAVTDVRRPTRAGARVPVLVFAGGINGHAPRPRA